MPYVCIFDRNLKKNCHIWNQRPWISLAAKFDGKLRILKFETKNTWFGSFWTGIPKQYCHIWNQHTEICLIAKFHKKTKMSKFVTKNTLFGYFWLRISKKYCHIWNQHPRICLIRELCKKNLKCLNLGSKMPYLGIFKLDV